MGYHVVIGFSSKLRVYSILYEDLLEEIELPLKNVKEVLHSKDKFSKC